MKTIYKSKNGQLTTEFEWSSLKELFKKVAEFQDIFENNNTHCESPVLFTVRTIDGNDFFEKKCTVCHKTFRYGQHKVGGNLFPDSARGWLKWSPADNTEAQSAPVKGKK